MSTFHAVLWLLHICGLEQGTWAFTACNTDQVCHSQHVEDKQITCYAREACADAELTGTDSMPRSINCGGSNSCDSANLLAFQYAYCHGAQSCKHAKSMSSDHIECGGDSSCQAVAELIETRNIYCQGSSSCSQNSIKSGISIICNAVNACHSCQLQALESIACNARHSCAASSLLSKSGDVTCNGKASCHSTQIQTNAVNAYAAYAAAYADIDAQRVHAMAYYSLSYAHIDSKIHDKVHVTAAGYLSGYGAMLLCQASSECVLECRANACLNMHFVCLHGAKCEIIPNECMTNRNAASDGIDCPVWSQSSSQQEDPSLIAYVEQRKAERSGLMIMADVASTDRERIAHHVKQLSAWQFVSSSLVYSNVCTASILFAITMIASCGYYAAKYDERHMYKEIE